MYDQTIIPPLVLTATLLTQEVSHGMIVSMEKDPPGPLFFLLPNQWKTFYSLSLGCSLLVGQWQMAMAGLITVILVFLRYFFVSLKSQRQTKLNQSLKKKNTKKRW